MRILCVSAQLPALGLHAGGVRVFQVLRGLARRHEVHLLSLVSRESERENIPALEGFCARVEVVLRGQAPGVPNPFGLRPPYFLREWGNPDFRDLAWSEIRSGRHDVLLAEYLEATCVLPEVLPIPAALTHLEVQYPALRKAAGAKGPFDRRRWKGLANTVRMLHYERQACGRFDRVFVMTAEDADALLRIAPKLPVEVSAMGVDPEVFRPVAAPEDPCTLLFTGYYEHYPNTDAAEFLAREILPRIRREVPECRLFLVGSHPTPEVLALSGIEGVTVTGHVPDLRPWLSRATVFVAPIRLGKGMRGKVLEALAMRRPLVSTSLGVAGLEVRDGSEVLLAEGAEEFARKTVRLLRDPALRASIGGAGSELVRARYGWDAQVERYDRCLEDLHRRREAILSSRGISPPEFPRGWRPGPGWRDRRLLLPLGGLYLLGRAAGYRLEGSVRGRGAADAGDGRTDGAG